MICAALAAGMLTFGAGAYGTANYIYPQKYYDNITGTEKYGSLTNYFTHSTPPGSVIDVSMPCYSEDGPYGANMLYTKLSASDLETIRNYGLQFNMKVTDELSGYTQFTYKTTVDSSIVEAAGTNLPASLDLALKVNPVWNNGVATLSIYPVSTDLGGITLTYTIPWESWSTLLYCSGLPSNSDTYYSTDNGMTYRKVTANTDARLTFSSGTRISISADKDAKYYSIENSEKAICNKIFETMGESTESNAVHEESVNTFATSLTNDIKLALFGTQADNATKKVYISEKQLNDLIGTYLSSGAVLTKLTEAIMNTSDNRKVIDDEIYGIFGLDSSEKVVEIVRDDVTPTIRDRIMQTIYGTNTLPAAYKDMVRYYLDSMTRNEVNSLNTGISYLRSNVSAYRDMTTASVLQELNKIKQSLYANEGTVYSFGSIIELLKSGRTFNTTGSTTTVPFTGTTTTTSTADNTPSTYETVPAQASTNYSSQDINTQIAALRDRITALESEVNTLRADGSFNDWIYRNYGSIDSFIRAVTDEVSRKLRTESGITYSGSLSAYDVAVKNGYKGTETEWLNSLVGASAYEIAVRNGFKGSEAQWLNSLQGADGKDGLDGRDGRDGKDGRDGRDAVSVNTAASDSDRVIYVYGETRNSASVQSGERPLANGKSSGEGDDDEVVVINESTATITNNYTAGDTTTGNSDGAAAKAAAVSAVKPANPSTGAAAGLLIPAVAAASIFLIKKDKRKRGRR